MSWIAGDEGKINLPLGRDLVIEVPEYPLIFESPVSFIEPQKDAPRDDSDYEEEEEENGETHGAANG